MRFVLSSKFGCVARVERFCFVHEIMGEGAEVHIRELEVLAHIGVTENERAKSQRLVVNVTVSLREPLQDLNDDITRTANYSAMALEVGELAAQRSYRLIETFADTVASRLLERFPVSRASVEVRKFVLPGSTFVSVTANRSSD